MSLFEQTDRVLAQYVNQFTGRSSGLDRLMFDLSDSAFLNGGIVMAAYWWLWVEGEKSGFYTKRRKLVVALLSALIVEAFRDSSRSFCLSTGLSGMLCARP